MNSGLCGNSVAVGCNGSRQTGVGRSTDTPGLGTCATVGCVSLTRGLRRGVLCCGADAYVCRVDTRVDAQFNR